MVGTCYTDIYAHIRDRKKIYRKTFRISMGHGGTFGSQVEIEKKKQAAATKLTDVSNDDNPSSILFLFLRGHCKSNAIYTIIDIHHTYIHNVKFDFCHSKILILWSFGVCVSMRLFSCTDCFWFLNRLLFSSILYWKSNSNSFSIYL